MPSSPPTEVVDDAVATLQAGGPDAELLALMIPAGLPAAQRAGLLAGVGSMCDAIRARGVPVQVLRVAGQDLEARGIPAGEDVEALMVLYTGERPALPGDDD